MDWSNQLPTRRVGILGTRGDRRLFVFFGLTHSLIIGEWLIDLTLKWR